MNNSKKITVVLLILFIVAITALNIYSLKKINNHKQLIKENILLKQKLNLLSEKIDSLLDKIKKMEAWEDSLRLSKNLKQIKKELREMGVGGIPVIDSTFAGINSELFMSYNNIVNKLQHLESKVGFDYTTHKKVFDYYKLKSDLDRYTPSIYPTFGRISDYYGWRFHPILHKRMFHHGLDIANEKGTPVYATADGVIRAAKRMKNFGKFISINHKYGYQTNYGHLSKIVVRKGQKVKRGQIIGYMGNTGRSTGTHLHYEVKRYNRYRNPIKYINRKKISL
jgi:murein DD-endopeptidase MepM/ murein hydrolase activator NlpD